MIIADTSIWIDHLRQANEGFQRLLHDEAVLMHPFVFAELALGRLTRHTVAELAKLSNAPLASHAEAMHLLSTHDLAGRGIGYVDLHLLASARLEPNQRLLTHDRRLATLAELLGVGFALYGNA